MRDAKPEDSDPKDTGPNVITHPPFLYAGGLFVASLLERLYPLLKLNTNLHYYIGGAMIAVAVVLAFSCFSRFVKAGTHAPTSKPSTAIVTTGLYRFSRNPIYLALTLLYLGIIVMDSNIWGVLALVPVLYLMTTGVIQREETYLEEKFGQDYLEYKASVRRWFTL